MDYQSLRIAGLTLEEILKLNDILMDDTLEDVSEDTSEVSPDQMISHITI